MRPIVRRLAWSAASAAAFYVVMRGLNSLFRTQLEADLALAFPGLTFQPPGLASVTVAEKARLAVQLSLSSDGGRLPSISLVFAAGAEVGVSPAEGIISITRTATGATVQGLAVGSALVTITYPPDTEGINDSLLGIAVFT